MNITRWTSQRVSTISNCLFLVAALALSSGCSTRNQMALKDKSQRIEASQDALAILMLTTTNEVKPTWSPIPLKISVDSQQANGATKRLEFSMGPQWNEIKAQSGVYIISLKLPPGEYLLREIKGVSEKSMALVSGRFTIPLYAKCKLNPGQIVYLGRINAVNRKRINEQELRAGPLLPLIDQASTGYSGGTFDIEFIDKYEDDMILLKRKFPLLEGRTIEKTILPQWTRPAGDDKR